MVRHRTVIWWGVFLAVLCMGLSTYIHRAHVQQKYEKNIVKIYSTYTTPSPYQPWAPEYPKRAIGSGVILEPGLVLTNAHVVANSTYIEVARQGDAERYIAHPMWSLMT